MQRWPTHKLKEIMDIWIVRNMDGDFVRLRSGPRSLPRLRRAARVHVRGPKTHAYTHVKTALALTWNSRKWRFKVAIYTEWLVGQD